MSQMSILLYSAPDKDTNMLSFCGLIIDKKLWHVGITPRDHIWLTDYDHTRKAALPVTANRAVIGVTMAMIVFAERITKAQLEGNPSIDWDKIPEFKELQDTIDKLLDANK